jgi:hypothetical protein
MPSATLGIDRSAQTYFRRSAVLTNVAPGRSIGFRRGRKGYPPCGSAHWPSRARSRWLLSSLPCPPRPAAAKPPCQNHWDGKWDTGSGQNHYGVVRFKQKNGETAVTGTYKFSGGGHINATAGGNECWTLYGRWKDKSGEGDLYWATCEI